MKGDAFVGLEPQSSWGVVDKLNLISNPTSDWGFLVRNEKTLLLRRKQEWLISVRVRFKKLDPCPRRAWTRDGRVAMNRLVIFTYLYPPKTLKG